MSSSVSDASCYSTEFFDKWMRLSDFNDHDDVVNFIEHMDQKLVMAASVISKIVLANNMRTQTDGDATSNDYYGARSDNMAVSLHYISLCSHKYASVLTQAERKFFLENIQVDFDSGDKPVLFGGTFVPRVAKEKRADKAEEVCDASTQVKYQRQSILRYKKDVSDALCKTKRRGPKRAYQFPQWHITKMHKKRQAQNIFLYGKREQ